MGNKETENRESWGSRFGFIMAAAGFSIGLGNIWRFPYLVGTNGGGAFVFVYLIICALIGIPLFTMEMSLGRKTQLNPVEGMRSLTKKGSPWVLFGWLGVLAAFVILTYYIQIMGWIAPLFIKDGFWTISWIKRLKRISQSSDCYRFLPSNPLGSRCEDLL